MPIDSLLVRQATFADLDHLAPLLDLHRQHQGRPPDLSACRSFLRDRFNHAESVLFLAELDAQPVGFAQLYPSFSSTALARVFILNDLYVAAAGRRRGVASGLLDAVEQYAWSLGACRISLNVTIPNTEAQALYRARGWVRDAEFLMHHRFPPQAGRG